IPPNDDMAADLKARALAARLARRGRTEAPRRWVVLTRDTAAAVPPAPTGLALRRIGPAEAPAAGRTFRLAYGLPPAFDDWIAALAGRPGWQGYAAFDGPAIVATALLFLGGDRAILTGAATLPAARGRGAQRALIALRLADARAAGAGIVQSHTGLPVADERNPSLDNMRAMGFRPSHVRRNFALPPDAGA
ncbi:MAG: hypothetical protein N2422_05195, partial [Rhodobacteraceae bacterium]|nr:hypothetical protein [Paracoccaceae bacterium]